MSIAVNRWDEKSRSPERDAVRSQVIEALEAQEIKETGMKKISTTTVEAFRKMQKLTIGLDLGDRSSWYCVLDESGAAVLEQRVSTTPKAMKEVFGGMPRSRIALETGTHSPWVSRLLSDSGKEVMGAKAGNGALTEGGGRKVVRLIAKRSPDWPGS